MDNIVIHDINHINIFSLPNFEELDILKSPFYSLINIAFATAPLLPDIRIT